MATHITAMSSESLFLFENVSHCELHQMPFIKNDKRGKQIARRFD